MNYAERRLRNARAQVVQAHAFFGTLLLRQRVVESAECEALATDGDNLYFNAAWVEATPTEELHGVCAHEALHPGLGHHTRRGDRDPALWNEACDYVINLVLVDCGFKLPKGALIDQAYRGMTAEQVYAKLREKRQQQQAQQEPPVPCDGGFPSLSELEAQADDQPRSDAGSGPPAESGDASSDPQPGSSPGSAQSGSPGPSKMPNVGGCGCVMDAPAANDAERQTKEAEWKVALAQAATIARAAGDLPGSLVSLIDAALDPRLDPMALLRRYMDQFSRADYSWAAPNRRFVAGGTYLPSLRSEQLGPVLFVIDSSASMPDASLAAALSEVSSICSTLRPEWVDVIVHDVRVTKHLRFDAGDEIVVPITGRGGTAFAPVCDWINEQDEQYACVIWFTDLEPSDWHRATKRAPAVPVLWLDYSDSTIEPPFGDETVRMPKEAA
jgi:predicted metal-dependent peptidase